MIEAVVFDLDGVLVDSEPVWEQVHRQEVAAAERRRWSCRDQRKASGESWAGSDGCRW